MRVGLVFYLLVGLIFGYFYRYQINPDGISYLDIAQKYSQGNFADAINGYWGPLLSWLFVPGFLLKIPPLLTARLINLLIGCLAIIAFNQILNLLKLRSAFRMPVLMTAGVLIASLSFSAITPDLLLSTILVFYLCLSLKPEHSNNLKSPIFIGLLGALAYLAKSFGWPFFVASFSVTQIYFWFKAKKDSKIYLVKQYLITMAVFILISGLWIFLISSKYGFLTLGTAGSYNHAILNPVHSGHPMYDQGLFTPPNQTATSIWEDPSYFHLKDWQPLSSGSLLKHQISLILDNLKQTVIIFEGFSILTLVILGSIFFVFKRKLFNDQLALILLSCGIYLLGYLPILVLDRYLWFDLMLFFVIGSYIFDKLNLPKFLFYLYLISFSIRPSINLINDYESESQVYNLGQNLSKIIQTNSNIASNNNWNWQQSLYLSFLLDSHYFGQTKPELTEQQLISQLKQFQINYYLVWGDFNYDDYLKTQIKPVFTDPGQKLTVYTLNY